MKQFIFYGYESCSTCDSCLFGFNGNICILYHGLKISCLEYERHDKKSIVYQTSLDHSKQIVEYITIKEVRSKNGCHTCVFSYKNAFGRRFCLKPEFISDCSFGTAYVLDSIYYKY